MHSTGEGRKKLRFLSSMRTWVRNCSTKVRNQLQKWDDETPQTTITKLDGFVFITLLVLWIPYYLWIEHWLSYVNTDSAKWVLAAQVPASAAILGLLVAAVSFRWRAQLDQEKDVRSFVDSSLRKLADSGSRPNDSTVSIINDAYGRCLSAMKGRKRAGQPSAESDYVNLGRLWAIKELSHVCSLGANITYNRILKKRHVNELWEVSKQSRDSAINMWDSYHVTPSEFMLEMHDTLANISGIASLQHGNAKQDAGQRRYMVNSEDSHGIVDAVRQELGRTPHWLIAQRMKFTRSRFLPIFYINCLLLFLALILSLLALAVIGDVLPISLGEDTIGPLVAVPAGALLFAITWTFLTVLISIR